MPAAPNQDRLRQIAILVSSVDAAAARQLLLHLPTETAKQVRNMAANLGPVSPEEKRRILAAFQQSSASAAPPAKPSSPPQPTLGSQAADSAPIGQSPVNAPLRSDEVDHAVSELSSQATLDSDRAAQDSKSQASPSPWDGISDVALLRFVQGERPAVIAVVASQLKPHVAATILGHLPPELSCDVIRRLASLEEIDAEAKAAIDEHVRTELGAYRQRVESQIENSRRMQALYQAAPEAVRSQWQHALDASNEFTFGSNSAQEPIPAATSETIRSSGVRVVPLPSRHAQPIGAQIGVQASAMAQAEDAFADDAQANDIGGMLDMTESSTVAGPTLAELYGDAAITTADLPVQTAATPEHRQDAQPSILPVPGNAQSAPSQPDSAERAAVQAQCERIRDMPPHWIAALLSNTDSETVLLALAGATPNFMRRFYGMLDRRDARTLDARLRQIGPLKIRDIDEAQARIVEKSKLIAGQSSPDHTTRKAA